MTSDRVPMVTFNSPGFFLCNKKSLRLKYNLHSQFYIDMFKVSKLLPMDAFCCCNDPLIVVDESTAHGLTLPGDGNDIRELFCTT
jgi:hypothetical protein